MLLKKDILPQPLFDCDTNLGLSRALSAAVKTGLTDQLSGNFKSASDISQKAGLNENVVSLVLDCLEALEYVNKKKGKYAFSQMGKKFLNRDSTSNLINYILFSEQVHYRSFFPLEEILQTGRKSNDNLKGFTDEEWKLFTLAMQDLARLNIDEITKAVPTPEGEAKLLDLGGSHGLYSIYQCKKNPSLKADILDLEAVRPYLKQNIQKYRMQDRVSFKPGDFMETEWDPNCDMILAFNIIHGMNEQDNQKLFNKARQSLKKGGLFVIFDQFKGIAGKSQLSRAVPAAIGLNLYIQTGGCTYSTDELNDSLNQTGFSSVKVKKLRTPGLGLVIGKK